MTARTLATGARRVLAGMAHGTTTVCAATSAARDHSTELKMFRVLGGFHGKPLDVLTAYVALVQAESGSDAAAYVESLCTEMLPVVWRRKLARFVVGNCGPFEPAVARRLLECARKLGFPLHVWAGTSPSAIPLALEMEALSIALDRVGDDEIRSLAGARTIAQLQPASLFWRRSERQTAARTLIDSGAAIALTSGFGLEDGPTYNMQMVLSLACSEMKCRRRGPFRQPPSTPLIRSGASPRVARWSLASGPDVIILNVEDYRDLPHRFGMNHVHMVFKNGTAIYQEGEVTHWPGK